jgi:hypothetical protein
VTSCSVWPLDKPGVAFNLILIVVVKGLVLELVCVEMTILPSCRHFVSGQLLKLYHLDMSLEQSYACGD